MRVDLAAVVSVAALLLADGVLLALQRDPVVAAVGAWFLFSLVYGCTARRTP